ncbi:MAG: M3 family metallopeptidase [Bacteroidales bacterium]|nr:M3 family metallopeptidase [Bacteroidales bacterium]
MKKLIIMFFVVAMGLMACTEKEPENPFFANWDTPFGIPPFDKISNEHYMPAFIRGFEEQMKEIDAIVNNSEEPTFENTIKAMEYTGSLLRKVSQTFSPINSANTSEEMQAISRELSPLSSKHSDDISLNEKLFERIKSVYENQDKFNLTSEEKRVLELRYKNFIRNGAGLSSEDKDKLRKINEQLSMNTLNFGQNLLAETNDFKLIIEDSANLAGLPDGLINQSAVAAKNAGMEGKWVFTLHAPSIWPFLQYSQNRDLREKIFTAYASRGNNGNEKDNNKIISEIARLRMERANLLGYESHADFVLEQNMAKDPETVLAFLEQIWNAAIPVAKAEAAAQNEMIKKEGGNFKLEPWDWWYYTEKIKKDKYDLDDEQTRPYFAVDNVRDGMFYVANRLYGLEFAERTDVPTYHPDARAYEVSREGNHVGILFIDLFPRASKNGGAWCTAFRGQRRDADGNMVTPLVSIVCNFTPPSEGKPALLTSEEAGTMFHEFGHALHQLLSNSTYPSVSGTSVARDFVELPSQIMEHWVLEPEVLKVYAKHYQTGEILPQEIIDKLDRAGKFNMGFTTIEYVAASLLDMEYHSIKAPQEINARQFEADAMNKYGLISEIIPRYKSTYFSHIFSGGYSSGYYSYIWCEQLDADAFEAFRETDDIFNKDVADAFEREILSKGGSAEAKQLWLNFRGKEPAIEALLKNRGLLN